MSQYIHVGIFLITVPNLIVIALMVVAFVVAVIVQLPHPPAEAPDDAARPDSAETLATPPPPSGRG